jgi:hypothetical protein
MFLIVKDSVIQSCSHSPVNEEACTANGEQVLEISDEEFTPEMIGALYTGAQLVANYVADVAEA